MKLEEFKLLYSIVNGTIDEMQIAVNRHCKDKLLNVMRTEN